MGAWLNMLRARWAGFLRPGDGARDFDEEIEAHLEMATEDHIRRGLSPREARRRAILELGPTERLREAAADARGLPWLTGSWLDLKLGARRLRKSWGLTLVAGFALTVVITLAAGAFEVLDILAGTDLPLEDGDRVVVLQVWDPDRGDGVGASPEDFERWREHLRTVRGVGAFRLAERNLEVTDSGRSGPGLVVEVAEISASAFPLTRISPTLGRPLLPEDEAASAEPVLVLGHREWQRRFDADPAILGRRVRLDGRTHTVVGVMPEGFAFPVSQSYWVPLRLGADGYAPDAGAERLLVFARLRDGVSTERAGQELRGLGRAPELHPAAGPVDPAPEPELRVVPYTRAVLTGVDGWMMHLALLAFLLLLVPPAVNVAILVYARTITRQGEFAARYVLGASRFHIVFQLFLEILVLAAGAGVLALGIAHLAVRKMVTEGRAHGDLPFWIDLHLSPRTVLVVGVLAVAAALLAGALPALRATGRGMQTGLRAMGGRTTPAHLGAVWTTLIVVQVAVSTAVLPFSAEMAWGTVRSGVLGPGFAAESYLTARLETGPPPSGAPVKDPGRFGRLRDELVRRLSAEPGIAAVSVAARVPGEEPWLRVVQEDPEDAEARNAFGASLVTRVNRVDAAYFDLFELPVLAGRRFEAADFDPARRSVVVNRSFAMQVLGESNPVGRRIAYRERPGEDVAALSGAEPDTWYEIVGVVSDVHRNTASQAVYHPARPTGSAVTLLLRAATDTADAAGTLRSTTWAVDPSLRVADVRALDEIYRRRAVGNWMGAGTLLAMIASLLWLSVAGIYALMSFTVGRRRREIGIRAALGASPGRLVASVFRRALAQVGLGAAVGLWIALLVDRLVPIEDLGGWEIPGAVPAAAAVLTAAALLALIEPARRGLAVEPVEELRQG